ncbi:HNH endonuclease [Ammoniphilus sp. YIM 78166]|uniref:HNH endonuclease n=1 Tax=Ammoniphilus sp. YIM 78166 TaxID=1644106 RepID=UPI00106F25AE|nr:HNH endonuclease [Ammoniphilus sp. YIM 78166]
MPAKPKKPCASPGCPALTTERYCERHQAKQLKDRRDRHRYYDDYLRDQKARSFYQSIEWQRTRLKALMRDHHLCQHCLRDKRIKPADMVHHVNEVRKHWEQRLVLSNLISLCNACHNRVHGGYRGESRG